MFKCLSETEGNVALGPEVQFPVKVLYTTSYTSARQNWNERMSMTKTYDGVDFNWTYNFGTLNDVYELSLRGKGNAVVCFAELDWL